MSLLFLCVNKDNIYNAYTALQIGENPVMTMEQVRAKGKSSAKYIFSAWGMPVLTEDEIKKYFPSLRAVFYAAGTVQAFARPFLALGIKVFSAWAANAVPVAEFTAAQIVLANKGYFRMDKVYREKGHKQALEFSNNYCGNFGARVGLLGAGMIGKCVISLLKPYRIELWVFDPFLTQETAMELGVKKASLEEVFAGCSVVSNHLANNELTKGLLNYHLFSKLQPYAYFINTGRGAQLNSSDFLRFMGERQDCTALLDVTDPTEPLEKASEYFKHQNIIHSPHRAGSQTKEIYRMGEYMLGEYSSLQNGKALKYEVTEKMLETMA